MFFVLGFCQRDQVAAGRLLEWIERLGGCQRHDCLLVAARATEQQAVQGVVTLAKRSFRNVTLIRPPVSIEPTVPGPWQNGRDASAPNSLWRSAAAYMQKVVKQPWLWGEPDVVPIKAEWLTSIEADYVHADKPFMGVLWDHPRPHMTGVAVYPADSLRLNTFWVNLGKVPWDLVRPEVVLKHFAPTTLIQHEWGDVRTGAAPTFPDHQSLILVRPETVLFHRCKDGSLIARLSIKTEKPLPKPVVSKPTLLQRVLSSIPIKPKPAMNTDWLPLTVVVTSHKRTELLEKAVASCVQGGVRNVVITATGVDDKMNATLDKLVKESFKPVILRHGPEVTSNQAWLAGVKAATTDYVAILHDDDLFLPDYGKCALRIVSNQADFGMMQAHNHGCPNYLNSISKEEGFLPVSLIQKQITKPRTLAISPICGVFKKNDLVEWLTNAEGLPSECYYRPDFLVGNDLLIWLEACKKYDVFYHAAQPGVSHGHWEGSTTVDDLARANRLFGMYDRVREWFLAGEKVVPRLQIITIVLDGMPMITWHLPILNQLTIPWRWHIVEGASMNTHCTKWCKPQEPRLSLDGTTEFLDSISGHPRIRIYRKEEWDGKVAMFNEVIDKLDTPCVLMEIDADEVWTAQQMEAVVRMFESEPTRTHAMFWCQYYLGPDIILASRNCYANAPSQEWKRAWSFKPGMRFDRHEPPIMSGEAQGFTHDETEKLGLVFHHYAYAFQSQVEYKERFYGYENAVDQWLHLQQNTQWPTKLSDHLAWVKDNALAKRL